MPLQGRDLFQILGLMGQWHHIGIKTGSFHCAVFVCFQTGSYYAALVGLELDPPASASQVLGLVCTTTAQLKT